MGQGHTKVDRYFYLLDEQSDLVFEMDGFLQAKEKLDDPDRWMLIMMCPACHQGLRIDTAKKPIEISDFGIETGEPIACTYILSGSTEHDGYRGLCPFRGEFQPPKAPEFGPVRVADGSIVRVRIDARIRRAL